MRESRSPQSAVVWKHGSSEAPKHAPPAVRGSPLGPGSRAPATVVRRPHRGTQKPRGLPAPARGAADATSSRARRAGAAAPSGSDDRSHPGADGPTPFGGPFDRRAPSGCPLRLRPFAPSRISALLGRNAVRVRESDMLRLRSPAHLRRGSSRMRESDTHRLDAPRTTSYVPSLRFRRSRATDSRCRASRGTGPGARGRRGRRSGGSWGRATSTRSGRTP